MTDMSEEDRTTISIIVPSFNRAGYLHGALTSLTQQRTEDRFEYEVIVVDNASTDNTREVVENFAKTSSIAVRYLHESNPGDAPPRNRGIRESRSQWLAFFDDDQFAEPDWLLNLLTAARTHNAILIGGPVHLDLDKNTCAKLSPACRSTLREMQPYSEDRPYELDVIPGTGNLFVARELFEQVGLFAENIREGGSDWKLVNDARAHGIEPWYASRAVIRHRVEPNRMTPEYFCWDAQNGGVSQADFDCKKHGITGLLVRCAARLLRATAFLPSHAVAKVRPPEVGASEASMVCWRTEGYLRRSLTLIAPRFFPQRAFHEYVDFRTGRVVGT